MSLVFKLLCVPTGLHGYAISPVGFQMSAGLNISAFERKDGERTRLCSIVSLYEDLGARDLLLGVCDSLAWTFKGDLEFKTDWWRFKYLADPGLRTEAGQVAAQADLILLAACSPQLPLDVQQWFEDWVPNRKVADGALVFVQSASAADPDTPLPLMSYLRLTARRAHLDYLRLNSSWSSDGIVRFRVFQPDSGDLLADDDRPLHWGINE